MGLNLVSNRVVITILMGLTEFMAVCRFKLATDAIRFVLKKKEFASIDDFIMVSPKLKAQAAFQALYDLL